MISFIRSWKWTLPAVVLVIVVSALLLAGK
jgi:hypothetical protein